MAVQKKNISKICVLSFSARKEIRELYVECYENDSSNEIKEEKDRLKYRQELTNKLETGIDSIIFDKKNIVKSYNNTEVNRDKIFKSKYEILDYLHLAGLGDIEESSLESNWGLFDWLAAYYFKNFLRDPSKTKYIVTPLWFLCSRGRVHLDEAYLCQPNEMPTQNNELKRQVLHHHYFYFRQFVNTSNKDVKNALKEYYNTPLNVFGERYEQIYASRRDRLLENTLLYVSGHLNLIGNIDDPRGARNIKVLQEHMRNEYHINKLPFKKYKKMIDDVCDF